MDGRFSHPFVKGDKEDPRFILEVSDSPPFSGVVNDEKFTPTPSPRKRRALQKRVVSVPIGYVDGSRLKGEGAPPSDSWAWRKYGQKPIKGSPYPRGYYRCSSSKGCPARKQVERSRLDPGMLVITYACEHNHSWPTSKTSNQTPKSTTSTGSDLEKSLPQEPTSLPAQPKPEPEIEPEVEPECQFSGLVEDPLMTSNDFSWFADVASTSPTMFESQFYSGNVTDDTDMAMIFAMREEDESLFADLGELPECSVVFRRGFIEKEEEHRRCNLRASLCESTG
ncbi:hypothetical protein AQUCO_03900057v1 [Aquilegia coerulea]|uniref:WRKY domain-containing protein n=1 Tax=Aquilegia coerulea TaxID=218851 RepID=A0A2G5CRJ7_AQUCA|nr:hypothetical protein AQUCO_03900057v1 [Aquilegia coerulea]